VLDFNDGAHVKIYKNKSRGEILLKSGLRVRDWRARKDYCYLLTKHKPHMIIAHNSTDLNATRRVFFFSMPSLSSALGSVIEPARTASLEMPVSKSVNKPPKASIDAGKLAPCRKRFGLFEDSRCKRGHFVQAERLNYRWRFPEK
jgi:hypothetical protein